MHTLDELDAADFRYVSEGRSVDRAEVMPAIGLEDRVGVVMGPGTGGIGAGNFILSCVIDFYDTLRDRKEDFFEYPDFYTFQATTDPADYRMFDIYPDHKNVATEADAESVLRAVNDRAIDVLLVPNRWPSSPEIEDVTRRSAERGIESCFLYAPDGELDEKSFAIGAPRQPIEGWFETTAESIHETSPEANWRNGREDRRRIRQEFRRLSLEQALEYLPADERRAVP